MKRARHPSSSSSSSGDDDLDDGSTSTSWSQHSKSHHRRTKGKKPSEVFRTDLITAMKLHDSCQLSAEDFYILSDPWRQEWEKGVQVPVSPNSIPQPSVRVVGEKPPAVMFTRPKKLIRSSGFEAPVLGYVGIRTLAEDTCRYDLNGQDVAWLQIANEEFTKLGMAPLNELTMERVMEQFEQRCYDNMSHAMETEEGLGIEYDEDVVCDVCQSPDGEDGNEMVFCDKCNICVHQACYGILKVPAGSWLCRICALGILPKCQLCPKKGGAMKPTRSGTKWVHVSCALWIPEVSIGNPEKMEPITNISHVPSNRWSLICCVCKEKTGACIQCSAKNCRTAFHVTCGQHRGLKMSTILDEADEVKFKSFCPKHSGLKTSEDDEEVPAEEDCGRRGDRGSPRLRPAPDTPYSDHLEATRLSGRKLRVQQLEEEFFCFVPVQDVARDLALAEEAVDFLFQYWKLRRKANFNQPLITPKKEEEDTLARREQEVLLRRLRLFTHLRQDLERVRNLTYMVTRREKMKRSACRVQEQIFHHIIRLLEQDRLAGAPSTRRFSEDLFYFKPPPALPSAARTLLKGPSAPNAAPAPLPPPSQPRLEKVTDTKSTSMSSPGGPACPPKTEDKLTRQVEVRLNAISLSPADYRRFCRSGGPAEAAVKADRPQERRSMETRRQSAELRANHVLTPAAGAEDRRRRAGPQEPSPVKTRTVPRADERLRNPAAYRDHEEADAQNTKPLPAVAVVTKDSGPLRRANASQRNGPLAPSRTSGAHQKNWGSFRIPRKSGAKDTRREVGPQPRRALERGSADTPLLRTRLRIGTENHATNAELGQPEQDSSGKRCLAHRLRSHDLGAKRYGSDIIRRGVLAS
ncbi:protein Jade-1 isoform X2 [Denticeps clupeoides]|uniref:Protein Jade-1 n=1 Tax=Denticeps clupeoides TaxID=299321 RepID=A0AAY4AAR6_9TELE|nr:protein Jade-1 isoform X2 [Denticeps clupeoides]